MRKRLIEYKFYLLIALLLILSFSLRIINLDNLPVFADEAIYIRWAQIMRAESTLRFLPLSDGKQPLFMWMVIPFLKLISDPLIAGRILSVFTGVATTLGVILLTRELFKSERTSLFAGFLYAISPMMIFFDRMALTDSMLTAFGVWFLYFLILAITRTRFDYAMLSGMALGGALLTKSTALFFVILMPSVVLTSNIKLNFKRNNLFVALNIIFYSVTVFLLAFGMYNILRLGPNYHMLKIRNYDYVYPYLHILTDPLNPFLSHLKATFEYLYLLAPFSAIALFILAVLTNFKDKKVWLMLIYFLIPIMLVLMYSKTLTTRYIIFTIPFFYVIAALALVNADKITKKAAYLFFGIFLIQSSVFSIKLYTNPQTLNLPRSERSGYLEEWTAGYGIRESSEVIREFHDGNIDKGIVVGTEGYFGTLPDGLQMYLNDHPDITVIGVGIDLTEVPKSLKESFQSGNKTYLVINNSRLKIPDYEKAGLDIIAQYPKANRLTGSREYNLYGSQEVLNLFELTE